MSEAGLRTQAAQLIRYALAGGFATAAHYALMALLLHGGWPPVSASTAGAIGGALIAYAINRRWTFRATHSTARWLRFMAVAALAVLLNAILLATIHHWLIQSIMVAQLLTTALVFVATFLINRNWSFA
ncbi:MAG: GtrA family protein [Xanthomonadales bacterium]|nr:GtrA family protein [Xanthomonadales bacterium]